MKSGGVRICVKEGGRDRSRCVKNSCNGVSSEGNRKVIKKMG